MLKLSFSQNWNGKLFLNNFGTVRIHNEEKYFVGNKFELELKNTPLGIVEVMAVRTFKFGGISNVLSYLDVGKPAHYLAELMRNFYGRTQKIDDHLQLDHIVLHYTHRNLPAHAALLREWWQEQLEKQPLSAQLEIFE